MVGVVVWVLLAGLKFSWRRVSFYTKFRRAGGVVWRASRLYSFWEAQVGLFLLRKTWRASFLTASKIACSEPTSDKLFPPCHLYEKKTFKKLVPKVSIFKYSDILGAKIDIDLLAISKTFEMLEKFNQPL